MKPAVSMSLLTDALEGPCCWSQPAGLATTLRTSSTTSSGGWRGARCFIKKSMRQKCSCFSCLKLFLKLCCWYIYNMYTYMYIYILHIFFNTHMIYISYRQILSIGVVYTHVYYMLMCTKPIFIHCTEVRQREREQVQQTVFSPPVRGEIEVIYKKP